MATIAQAIVLVGGPVDKAERDKIRARANTLKEIEVLEKIRDAIAKGPALYIGADPAAVVKIDGPTLESLRPGVLAAIDSATRAQEEGLR